MFHTIAMFVNHTFKKLSIKYYICVKPDIQGLTNDTTMHDASISKRVITYRRIDMKLSCSNQTTQRTLRVFFGFDALLVWRRINWYFRLEYCGTAFAITRPINTLCFFM